MTDAARAHGFLRRSRARVSLSIRPGFAFGAVALGAIAVGVVASGADSARADAIDPNVPSVIIVGAPRGAATQARLDSRRTGRSKTALPEAPAELWRRSLGTIEVSPLIDERGEITLVLASAEIVALSRDGKEMWRTRMQGGGPAAAPIRLSDGTACVVSTGGFLVGVSARGKVRFSTSLGVRGPDLMAAPVATDDGGAAVVAGRSLLTVDVDGRIETETNLPVHVSTAPVVTADGFLVIGDDGSVTRVRPPNQPQKVGSFQGTLDGGAVLADERTLLGVMRDRLLALDLKTGLVSVRASTGNYATIDGPVVVAENRTVFFTTSDGLLLGIDRTGQEVSRATIERVVLPLQPSGQPGMAPSYPPGYPPGGLGGGGLPYYNPQSQRSNPPLVIDAAGRVAFLRTAGRFGISGAGLRALPAAEATQRAPDGAKGDAQVSPTVGGSGVSVDIVSEHVCNTPIAVLPSGEGRVTVVCREGLVAVFGD